jgi:hypothetical protein
MTCDSEIMQMPVREDCQDKPIIYLKFDARKSVPIRETEQQRGYFLTFKEPRESIQRNRFRQPMKPESVFLNVYGTQE